MTKKCPYCAEEVQEEAKICKHCQGDIAKKEEEIKKANSIWRKNIGGDTKPYEWTTKSIVIVLGFTALVFFILYQATDHTPTSSSSKTKNSTQQTGTSNNMPDATQAEVVAREFVEKYLKYPDNSEFPGMFDDRAKVSNTGKRYKIEHWVKASNGFGVLEKKYYTISLDYNGGNWADKNSWTEVSFNFK